MTLRHPDPRTVPLVVPPRQIRRPETAPELRPSDFRQSLSGVLSLPEKVHFFRTRSRPSSPVREMVSRESASSAGSEKTPPSPAHLHELQYLITYGIVNNFYYNLVSYSARTGWLAVAVEDEGYWWDGRNMVQSFFLSENRQEIAAVSCCGRFVAIATVDGLVYMVDDQSEQIVSEYQCMDHVQCFEWDPAGYLYCGDSGGSVHILRVQDGVTAVVCVVAAFSQPITGLTVNSTHTHLAAGSNENAAMVWNIEHLHSPKKVAILPHSSAVKGIEFCPWSPFLLATGGGSHDQHVRIWHAETGSLLHARHTRGQITAVIWSKYEKALAVAFGLTTASPPGILSVYSFPQLSVVAQIPGHSLRALSVAVDQNQSKVALQTHDGMVRTYALWPQRPGQLPLTEHVYSPGDLGSSILENIEAVPRLHGIR